jgi:hypothetical protein
VTGAVKLVSLRPGSVRSWCGEASQGDQHEEHELQDGSGNRGDTRDTAKEDYPSEAQVIAALDAQTITPVFAVAGGPFVEAPYQALLASLGRGKVVPLKSDGSNLIDAIFSGMAGCYCR